MRIPDSQYYRASQQALAARRSELDTLYRQSATGRRVNKPSDDPLAAARARRAVARETRAADHERAANSAGAALQVADSVLSEVGSALQRIRQLAVQAGNDSLSAENRVAIAAEVKELRAHLLGLANTRMGDRYIFAGLADDAPAFDQAGVYQGDSGEQRVEISPGVMVNMGISGDEVFGAVGGQDIFAAIDDFETALRADDMPAMQGAIETLASADSQISEIRGRIGASMMSVEIGQSVAQRTRLDATEEWNALVAADPFQVYSEISRARQALQAAVQIAGQLPQPGLVSR